MGVAAAAVISGIAALIGGGVSAAGAGISAEEKRKQEEKLAAVGAERFGQTFRQTSRQNDRAQGLAGLNYLAEQRDRAMGSFQKGRFKTDLMKALKAPAPGQSVFSAAQSAGRG